jgi:hypothetical protein
VDVAHATVALLRDARLASGKSKDLLRAAGLPSLKRTNVHVAKDVHRARAGKALSPVLLVRGDARFQRPLLIADGYHRICAAHLIDEDAEIAFFMADLGESGPAAARPRRSVGRLTSGLPIE